VIEVKAYIDPDGVCRLAERNLGPEYGTPFVAAVTAPTTPSDPAPYFPHVCGQTPTSGETKDYSSKSPRQTLIDRLRNEILRAAREGQDEDGTMSSLEWFHATVKELFVMDGIISQAEIDDAEEKFRNTWKPPSCNRCGSYIDPSDGPCICYAR